MADKSFDRLDGLLDSLDALQRVAFAFGNDISRCQDGVRQALRDENRSAEQFWASTMIRLLFAAVEAVTSSMRDLVLKNQEHITPPLTLGEMSVLGEVRYASRKGEVVEQPSFNRGEENVLLALSYFPAIWSARRPVDRASDGWKDFRAATRVRHRLTHPKSTADLEVSREELAISARTMKWFYSTQVTALIEEGTRAARATLDDLKQKHPPGAEPEQQHPTGGQDKP